MGRAFHIPGIFFLFSAFVLLFLVSISLPFLTALDFTRVHFTQGSPFIGNNGDAVNQLRVSPIRSLHAYCLCLLGRVLLRKERTNMGDLLEATGCFVAVFSKLFVCYDQY